MKSLFNSIRFRNVTCKNIFRINPIGFILVVALGLRVIFLVQHFQQNPTFDTPVVDALYHDRWAQEIAAGTASDGPFFRAPLYPYSLAAIYAAFGHNYLIPRMLQHLLGLLSIYLTYRIGRKIFSARIGLLAAGMMAIYGLFLFFEGELLLDSFALFLNLAAVTWLISMKPERHAPWLAAGALVGLAALARPNILLFIPAVIGWIYLTFAHKMTLSGKHFKVFLFLLGIGILIAPVTLRNYRVGKDRVLIASQGGINFYLGHNPEADGFSAIFPGLGSYWDYDDVAFQASQTARKKLKPSEVSDFYFRQGLNFIKNQPVEFLKLLARKFYLLFNATEISNNLDFYFARRFTPVLLWLPLDFGIVGPLLLLGFLLLLRKQFPVTREISLVLLFILTYSLSLLAFFITDRFRLALLPFYLIFAAAALNWLREKIIQRDPKNLVWAAAILVIAAFLINSHWTGQNVKSVTAESHVRLGNCYLRKGLAHRALLEFNQALAVDSTQALAYLNQGVIFFKQGNLARAEVAFLNEIKNNPGEALAHNNLSVLYRNLGKFQAAVETARQAFSRRPNLESAHYNLALALDASGAHESALRALDLALKSPLASFPRLRYLKGQFHQTAGESGKAQACFQQVISQPASRSLAASLNLSDLMNQSLAPDLSLPKLQAKAGYNLGVISLNARKFSEAKSHFEAAKNRDPALHEAWENLGLIYDAERNYPKTLTLLQQAVVLAPENAVYHFNLGLVWARLGNFAAAKSEFESALKYNPDFTAARERLAVVEKRL
jgi:tetratricopeptide (TPR) repeat protein